MPWSPKSVLHAHQRPFIRPFSVAQVANFAAFYRFYLRHPHRHLSRRQVHIRLGRMFQLPESSLELRSISSTLSRINFFSRNYVFQVYNVLDSLREEMNGYDRSPEGSDYEDEL